MSNNGGPAFPAHAQCGDETGMSLRDWFAGQAMVAIMDWPPDPNTADTVAELAYSQADAMLRAR